MNVFFKKSMGVFLAMAISSVGWGAGGVNEIELVTVKASNKATRVILQSSAPLKYVVEQSGVDVVLRFLDPTRCAKPAVEKTYSDLVDEIRYLYKEGKVPTSRRPELLEAILIHPRAAVAASFVQREWVLSIELKPAPTGETTWVNMTDVSKIIQTKEDRKSLPVAPELKDFIEVGLSNHPQFRIAQEEYRLAKFQYADALRNLFPSVTGKYSFSEGTLINDPTNNTDDVAFHRKEYGVEFGVPVFHSGQNYYTFRQMGFQKRTGEQNVLKTRGDISFEIKRAYHNLVKAQRSVAMRRDLNARAEKLIEVSRKKIQLGLITQADALGAESMFTQSYYRLLSDEKDLEIARLRLNALINTPARLPEAVAEPKETITSRTLLELNLTPESLIDLGVSHRPELLVARYNAEAQKFAAKAAEAQNRFRVDATYFRSKAGGAFEDQSLDMRNSWNAGIQASLSFLGSTARGARTQEHTVPDFGETTATDTRGTTASVGLLDSFKTIGQAWQANIAKERAVGEYEQARRNLEIDIREAYYNVQKAKIQIKGSETELDYREKELNIARQKERMNLIEPAQTLAAESAYGDAVANHEEAMAFYQVSLAGLERAVGMPLSSIPDFH